MESGPIKRSNQNRERKKQKARKRYIDKPKAYYKRYKSVEIQKLKKKYGYDIDNPQSVALKHQMEEFNQNTLDAYTKKYRFCKFGRMDNVVRKQKNGFSMQQNPFAKILGKIAGSVRDIGLKEAFWRIQKQAEERRLLYQN